MKTVMKAVALATIAVMSVSALAQGGGGQGRGQGRGGMMMGMGRGGGGPLSILNRNDVQLDLKLTTEQKTKLDDLRTKQQEEMRKAFEDMRSGGGMPDPEQMRERMKTYQEKNEKATNAILSVEQQKRLKEIYIQLQGNRAILDEKIQADLALTKEQKAKIADLQEKQQQAMTAAMEKMRNGEMDRDQMQELRTKNDGIMNTELGKVLTAEQAAKFKAMAGAPFKATDQPRQGRGGMGGPGGAGGAGGGGRPPVG